MELAREVRPELIDDAGTEYGFLLHDVGKIGVPDGILQKPGPLTEGERRQMETHTVLGEQMLGGVAVLQGEGLKVVRHHHERWDGGGYPDGLCGTDIPIGARIFAVADALDAMTSDRPYRGRDGLVRGGRRDHRPGEAAVRPVRGRRVPRRRAASPRDPPPVLCRLKSGSLRFADDAVRRMPRHTRLRASLAAASKLASAAKARGLSRDSGCPAARSV